MELGITEIMKILPHRPPMLLVDRILEIDPFHSATGIKNITMIEPQEHRGKIAMFGGMEHVKFKHPVVPGDQLVTKAEIVRVRGNFGLLHADGYVKDKLVASADFKFALKEPEEM